MSSACRPLPPAHGCKPWTPAAAFAFVAILAAEPIGAYIDAMAVSKQPTTKRCPICGKPAVERFRPFCSKRCADVDLHRWLSGSYAVPAVETDDESEPTAGGGDER